MTPNPYAGMLHVHIVQWLHMNVCLSHVATGVVSALVCGMQCETRPTWGPGRTRLAVGRVSLYQQWCAPAVTGAQCGEWHWLGPGPM